MDQHILDDQLSSSGQNNQRRRDLLPLWIKIFIWIFLIMSFAIPFILVMSAMGYPAELTIYGLTSYQPFSIVGLIITFIIGFKGVVAFGLWTEKEWAVRIAIMDAYLGIIACIFMMFVFPFLISADGSHFTIRLELIALAPYLLKMLKIKKEWAKRISMG